MKHQVVDHLAQALQGREAASEGTTAVQVALAQLRAKTRLRAFQMRAFGASGSSSAFSPALVANIGLDNPNMLAAIAKDAARERATTMPRHIISAKIARLYSRPTAEQRAIEADANALANSYGLWHGRRIASVCGGLEAPEAGRKPDTWRRIAHELSWRIGSEERRCVTR